jgi:hypothetical protein
MRRASERALIAGGLAMCAAASLPLITASLASRREQGDGQTPANALPQADSMPTESAGRC